MKKSLKITFIIILAVQTLIIAVFLGFCIASRGYKLDKNKLVNPDNKIYIYDQNNLKVQTLALGKEIVENNAIPNHVKNAFVAIEDKRFYSHNGIDFKGLIRATFNNIKSFSFKEGASTITQQLIKNTHLYSDKTLLRKFAEMKLAIRLEKVLEKDDILTCYLNTIYFGEGCYGISSASKFYFNKKVEDLSISEGACLAGMINAPSTYSLTKHEDKANNRKNIVLNKMLEQNYIDNNTFKKEKEVILSSYNGHYNGKYDYFNLIREELDLIQEKIPYSLNNCSVYTYYNESYQQLLADSLSSDKYDCEKSAIMFSSDNKIISYFSTCPDGNRQLGSILKPIAVYAPAIEENVYNSCSIIDDEKTDFNGYSPSNFGNVYYGKVSFKHSLAKSLNVCSAKILNNVGVEKALSYVKKTDIKISDEDNNLSVALGATYKGASLRQIASAYSVFLNDGYYKKPSCIKQIISPHGKKIYQEKSNENKIYGEDTVYIMNDILNETVKSGTAKKLNYLNKFLCAKTGTVGNSKANTDAYCISYNPEFLIGIRFTAKDNSYLDNNVTGGSNPTSVSSLIWNEYFKNNNELKFKMPKSVTEENIDKLSYDNEGVILLADKNTPERLIKKELFKKSNLPKSRSTQFSSPNIEKIETIVSNKSIGIRLCLTQYVDALIFRLENNKKIMLYDTFNSSNLFIDNNLESGRSYQYIVLPYFKMGDEIIYGKEIYLNKIKMPTEIVGNEFWWENEILFE